MKRSQLYPAIGWIVFLGIGSPLVWAKPPAPTDPSHERIVQKKDLPVVQAHHDKEEAFGWLGVVVQPVDPILKAQLDLPRGAGLVVVRVIPHSPAAKAGIRYADILQKFEGHWLFTPEQFRDLVRNEKPGKDILLDIIRHGESIRVLVELGKAPEEENEEYEEALWKKFGFKRPPEAPHIIASSSAKRLAKELREQIERLEAELASQRKQLQQIYQHVSTEFKELKEELEHAVKEYKEKPRIYHEFPYRPEHPQSNQKEEHESKKFIVIHGPGS